MLSLLLSMLLLFLLRLLLVLLLLLLLLRLLPAVLSLFSSTRSRSLLMARFLDGTLEAQTFAFPLEREERADAPATAPLVLHHNAPLRNAPGSARVRERDVWTTRELTRN